MKTRDEIASLLHEQEDLSGLRIFVWGTGNTTSLYQEGFKRLEEEGFFSIEGYCDNNPDKWGKEAFGKKVWSPDELSVISKEILVLIASPQPRVIHAVGKQLDEMGVKWRNIDNYILKGHRKEVLECIDILEDEKSKQVYSELIECKLEGRYPKEEFIDKDQYFSFRDNAEYDANEVFVDCGAFVGDTLESYVFKKDGAFKKYIAFEPDSANILAMTYRLDRIKREWNLSDDKFEIYPYGIADKTSSFYVERYDANNGFGSKIITNSNSNTEECKVVALDDFLKERYTFLKADIESYEYKLIMGAERTLREYEPKLAICVYHNSVDFYSIPLLLKKINSNYKFAIRHYTHVMSDSVVYAYTTLSEE